MSTPPTVLLTVPTLTNMVVSNPNKLSDIQPHTELVSYYTLRLNAALHWYFVRRKPNEAWPWFTANFRQELNAALARVAISQLTAEEIDVPFVLRALAYHFKNFTDDCIIELTPQFESLLLRSQESRNALSFMVPVEVYDYQWWTAEEHDVPAIITLDTTALALAMANHRKCVAAEVKIRRKMLAEQGVERVPPQWRPEFEVQDPVVGCLGCAYWSTRVAEMTEKIGDARDKMGARRDILFEKSDAARSRAMAFHLLSLMGDVDCNNPPDDNDLVKHSVKLSATPAGDLVDNRAPSLSPELPDSLPEDEDDEYEYEDDDKDKADEEDDNDDKDDDDDDDKDEDDDDDEDEDEDNEENADHKGSQHDGQQAKKGSANMAAGAKQDGGDTDFSTEFSD